MVETVLNDGAVDEVSSVHATYIKAYRHMLLARILDDKFASLYRMGKIHGGVFLGRGQEALSASIGLGLHKGDIFAPLIRDAAGRLAFGEPILDAVRTYLGSALGPMRARDGNIHRGRPKEGLMAMISHLGAMISVDNQYAYSTPTELQFACRSLLDKAAGYGVEGQAVDGTDLADCLEVVSDAIGKARSGHGPQVVVAELLRLCGHGEHDDAGYVDPAFKSSPLGRDCLKVAESFLLQQGWADAPMLAIWRNTAIQKVEETVAQVQREPGPDPYKEEWCALASKNLSEGYDDP